MIEQYLQVALELFKEIWFQLDSILGLEETEAFASVEAVENSVNMSYESIEIPAFTLFAF